ncbi:hypothetical protein K435DRAFT_829001 [Dendrothele bispora CBS 962.96]|uniref:Winged helix-turn helix domain-containing protein n=1 Tax=Dendrothele bispora (strain CBS 962.96) TaxID=1314807 RepID=A0A4S8M291_DENBC|nr:hypothetical protein K435DRAFT_829001 [Dendrothele bispora CBS 962.96]
MPRRTISRDLKARIPVLFYEQQMSVTRIRKVLGIGKTLVYDTLEYDRLYGQPYNPHAHHTGRPRKLTSHDARFIFNLRLISRRKTLYLDEIQLQLSIHMGIQVSITTVLRTMCRLYFSHKCTSAQAAERNDLQRAAHMFKIGELCTHPDQLMFTDEAARNRRTSQRRYGWAMKGGRCVIRQYFTKLEILLKTKPVSFVIVSYPKPASVHFEI